MNRIVLVGRLTRDPEIYYSGQKEMIAIARFTLAVRRRLTTQDENGQDADFINCVAFRKPAEFAQKYLHKGTKIALEGRLQTGSYVNREQRKIYTVDVIAERIEFAEGKKSSEAGENAGEASHPDGSADEDKFLTIPEGEEDEELPFN